MLMDYRSQGRYSIFWLGYQQIAAILAAFTLITFLKHLGDLNLHGIVGELIGIWSTVVRPAVKWLLDISLVAFVRWAFHWQLEIPLVIRDYFAAGLILYMSMEHAIDQDWGSQDNFIKIMIKFVLFIIAVPLWPFIIIVYPLQILLEAPKELKLNREYYIEEWKEILQVGSPFIYMFALLIANSFL